MDSGADPRRRPPSTAARRRSRSPLARPWPHRHQASPRASHIPRRRRRSSRSGSWLANEDLLHVFFGLPHNGERPLDARPSSTNTP